MQPPHHVVAAFGGAGEPSRLPGGRRSTWRCGEVVLKPSSAAEDELAWQATQLPEVALRLARPVRGSTGACIVDGWLATRFLAGDHRPARWLDIIGVGDALHAELAAMPRPRVLDARDDPWAIADRLAWGEAAADPPPRSPLIERLQRLVQPVTAASQVVHGDLTGNVLFADGLPPAVLDLSLYWRPRDYATAVIVVDALAWEGATAGHLAPALARPDLGQLLVRALLFRLYAAQLLEGRAGAGHEGRYHGAVDLAVALLVSRA
jgi:uncharacterized protein (TIGR02569 family)